jgi:hypothetical protein
MSRIGNKALSRASRDLCCTGCANAAGAWTRRSGAHEGRGEESPSRAPRDRQQGTGEEQAE